MLDGTKTTPGVLFFVSLESGKPRERQRGEDMRLRAYGVAAVVTAATLGFAKDAFA
jgi:hypothetical protein